MELDDVRDSAQEVHQQFRGWHWLGRAAIVLVLLFVLGGFGGLFYRALFYTWVDNYQFGYTYSYWTGHQEQVNHNGYVYSPFYQKAVHTIDLRPTQVCISSIQRVLNCKLVHFDPYPIDPETQLHGWELLIKWHGRNDYELPGTVGSGQANTHTLFSQILMNYAYDGSNKYYPFLVIEKEMKNDTVTQPGGAAPSAGAKQ